MVLHINAFRIYERTQCFCDYEVNIMLLFGKILDNQVMQKSEYHQA